MYTQCPECLTIYQLDNSELSGTHGNVYCNDCKTLFDALRTLTAKLPPEPINHLPTYPPRTEPPLLMRVAYRPHSPQNRLSANASERIAKPSQPPVFATPRHAPPAVHNWPWLAGSALLLLVLAGEFAWNDRKDLLDNPTVRAWADPICAQLGCRLPLRHDPAKLELLSRDIRPHPSVSGALIISATLRNDAAFAQPFPVVKIALSDLDEKPVAMRRFQPDEYLDDPHTITEGIAPGASTALVFEVADPGKNAVAFEFEFQ